MADLTPKGREILEHILVTMQERPDLVDMEHWVRINSTFNGKAFCGTAACIAGNVCLYAGLPEKLLDGAVLPSFDEVKQQIDPEFSDQLAVSVYYSEGRIHMKNIALSILFGKDHNGTEGDNLFYTMYWPAQFKERMYAIRGRGNEENFDKMKKDTRTKLGQVAIDRLKYYLETGE